MCTCFLQYLTFKFLGPQKEDTKHVSVNYVHVFGQHYTEKSVRSLEALQELVGGERDRVVLGCSLVMVRLRYKCHTFCFSLENRGIKVFLS